MPSRGKMVERRCAAERAVNAILWVVDGAANAVVAGATASAPVIAAVSGRRLIPAVSSKTGGDETEIASPAGPARGPPRKGTGGALSSWGQSAAAVPIAFMSSV